MKGSGKVTQSLPHFLKKKLPSAKVAIVSKALFFVGRRPGRGWRKYIWVTTVAVGALVMLDFREEPTEAVLSRVAGLSRRVQNLKSLRLTVSLSPEPSPTLAANDGLGTSGSAVTEVEERPPVETEEGIHTDTRTTIAKSCGRDPFDVFLKADRKLKIAQQLSVENGVSVDRAAAEVAPQPLRSSWVWRASESLKYFDYPSAARLPDRAAPHVFLAAWEAGPTGPGRSDQRIMYALSDGGMDTWSSPKALPTSPSRPAWNPVVWFNEKTQEVWVFFSQSTTCMASKGGKGRNMRRRGSGNDIGGRLQDLWNRGGDIMLVKSKDAQFWSVPTIIMQQGAINGYPKIVPSPPTWLEDHGAVLPFAEIRPERMTPSSQCSNEKKMDPVMGLLKARGNAASAMEWKHILGDLPREGHPSLVLTPNQTLALFSNEDSPTGVRRRLFMSTGTWSPSSQIDLAPPNGRAPIDVFDDYLIAVHYHEELRRQQTFGADHNSILNEKAPRSRRQKYKITSSQYELEVKRKVFDPKEQITSGIVVQFSIDEGKNWHKFGIAARAEGSKRVVNSIVNPTNPSFLKDMCRLAVFYCAKVTRTDSDYKYGGIMIGALPFKQKYAHEWLATEELENL